MRWFKRLGIQRRIMLYVALGLALMFSVDVYLGVLAIRKATELVYHERLGMAITTATVLEHNIDQLAHDVESVRGHWISAGSRDQFVGVGIDLLREVSSERPYPLIYGQSLWLVDSKGRVELTAPDSTAITADPLPSDLVSAAGVGNVLTAPLSPKTAQFGSLLVPVKDDTGRLIHIVVLNLAPVKEDKPYFSPPVAALGPINSEEPSETYRLEVLNPEGKVVLTQGGRNPLGATSSHWQLFKQVRPQDGGPFIFLHKPRKDQNFKAHIVVAAPTSSNSLLVTLEQPLDVAFALPIELRQRLVLFASLGFVAALAVAWVTTRHVVKPTERLTAAARRIAAGEVATPLNLGAQDEIGVLADSLETMRRRLQAWGLELEAQVQQRTAELEQRNRELRVLTVELQRKEELLRALLAKVLGAQEEERKRVSRELHDGIGQALSALTMGLERIGDGGPKGPNDLETRVDRLRELATDALRDLRRLTIALRPAALDDLGLVPAIRRYAELFLEPAGVEFEVQEEGATGRLDPSLETIVYRVVQEAINNIARHSGAAKAVIRLRSMPGVIAVTVRDNGRGFDPTLAIDSPGVGIQGMQERASLAGGKLTVDSKPDYGTVVRLEIPLKQPAGLSADA
ncbi:MAG: HAMP domain-containing protein [Chloroflexi bacterium]|nr:HAMP domain-containing protein [Chloroflexota bacterium]